MSSSTPPSQIWLLTGGAGYIGTHIADEFLRAGKAVVIYDSLYKGLSSRIDYLNKKHNTTIPLVKADIRDYETFEKTLSQYKITGIVHTAALKSVEESMSKRDDYIEVNYTATVQLLEIAKRAGVKHFIFSSTAAVYGNPDTYEACEEASSKKPINPYGESKLLAENSVSDYVMETGAIATSFRFFNVVGSESKALEDNSSTNLVPIIKKKLSSKSPITIFGSGYPTPDGTCVRDYVDVRDIAAAHLAAANSISDLPSAINIGTGKGVSVRELIDLALLITDEPNAKVEVSEGRPGDPAILFADVQLAEKVLGFVTKHSLESSLRSVFSPD